MVKATPVVVPNDVEAVGDGVSTFKQKLGHVFQFKRMRAGKNLTLKEEGDTIIIESPAIEKLDAAVEASTLAIAELTNRIPKDLNDIPVKGEFVSGTLGNVKIPRSNSASLGGGGAPMSTSIHGNASHTSTFITATDAIAPSILTEKGDVIYASAASTPAALPHGNAGDVLTSGGHAANPSWLAPIGGVDTTAIHKATASEISAMTEKATPIGADHMVIEDSAATNAKKRAYLSKIPARVGLNVKAYGAVGDGSTDDTTAIQAAITAALAAGVSGRGVDLFFPAGVYKTSSALTVVGNNVDLVGAGVGSTALYPQHTTGDVLNFGNGSTSTNVCGLRHMSLICASARTAGNTINVNLAHDITIFDFNITNYFVGVLVQGASIKVHIQEGQLNSGHAADGTAIKISNGAAGDTYISDLVMSNNPASKPLCGIDLVQTGHCSITKVNCTSFVNGLTINPQASNDVSYVFCDHSLFDSCGVYGLYFNPAASASARARSIIFTNTWFSGTTDATSYGVYIGGGAASIIDDITFIGCRILNNQRDGVKWVYTGAINLNFLGCTVAGNSQTSSGTYSGFDLAANCSDFCIMNCKIGIAGTATNTQLCAIKIAAGTSGAFRIIGNDVGGNVTPPYLNFGTLTGLGQLVKGNYPDVMANCNIYTLPTTAATSGTGETLLFKAAIPANAVRVGQYFKVTMHGYSSSTGTLIFRVRVGANGTTGDNQAWISTTSAAQVANNRAGFTVLVCVRSLTSVYADGCGYATAVVRPTLVGAPATAAIVASATWYIDVLATCSVGTFTAVVGSIEAL